MSWFERFFDSRTRELWHGPLGALRHAVIEEYYEGALRLRRSRWPLALRIELPIKPPKVLQARQLTFFTALFSLLAKLADSDGAVTRAELDALEDFMDRELKLSAKQKVLGLQLFRKARASNTSFEEYAKQYFGMFRTNRGMLENMIDILLGLALADRRLAVQEERLIKLALTIFRLKDADYERIRSRYRERREIAGKLATLKRTRPKRPTRREQKRQTHPPNAPSRPSPPNSAYAVLGCKRTDAVIVIKRTYRRLALIHHPDRLKARGLPEEFLKHSEKKFREIQEAYEHIRRERGFS